MTQRCGCCWVEEQSGCVRVIPWGCGIKIKGDPEREGFLQSQLRPWRPRPSISEVQWRHLVGDGKLRGRNMCEPGCEGVHAVTIPARASEHPCSIPKGRWPRG